MGNLVTKLTTNSMQLDESNISDVVSAEVIDLKALNHFAIVKFVILSLSLSLFPHCMEQVAKDKTPTASGSTRLFKNIWNYDPRSPSTFISRTPIAMFRNNSAGKFNHQELNESVESQIDIEILTPEEQDSLDSNTDLVQTIDVIEADFNRLADPR